MSMRFTVVRCQFFDRLLHKITEPVMSHTTQQVQYVAQHAQPFTHTSELTTLINRLKNKKVVMLGEASHGTQEFYDIRRELSQQLITKHGVNFIAVEGDWPACMAANRYIHGSPPTPAQTQVRPMSPASTSSRGESPPRLGEDAAAERVSVREVLKNFHRWPTWMWANTSVEQLINWMRDYNTKVRSTATSGATLTSSKPDVEVEEKKESDIPSQHLHTGWQAGFFGLDVYSLYDSIDVVLQELRAVDSALADRAAKNYACFAAYSDDEQAYARSLLTVPEGCKRQAMDVLKSAIALRAEAAKRGLDDADLAFDIEQNAKIVSGAEHYYAAMIQASYGGGRDLTWNIRDSHMHDTLKSLLKHYGPNSRAIVWAHNTHIGDASATSMAKNGEYNIGQLAREECGADNVALVGFSTYKGSVIASDSWGSDTTRYAVPEAREGSVDAMLHEAAHAMNCPAQFYLSLRNGDAQKVLSTTGPQRAIGVVYHPNVERHGNYVPTKLAQRYDELIYVDQTQALQPLQVRVHRRDMPAEFPFSRS